MVFGTASLLLLFYLACLIISFGNNSRLAAPHCIGGECASHQNCSGRRTLASAQDLTALNQLRTALVQLENYRQQGPPLMYRWGLYHGDQLLEAARHIYFDRFQRLLLANTQSNLVTALNALPASASTGLGL